MRESDLYRLVQGDQLQAFHETVVFQFQMGYNDAIDQHTTLGRKRTGILE
jgi:hypothetical protein